MAKTSYKELIIWQRAMEIVVEVYHLTKRLPKEEQYMLVNQLRRAAVSIPSNIAEGYTRHTTKDYIHFLNLSLGSNSEVETQLEICRRLEYLDNTDKADRLCDEVGKMLNTIIQKPSLHKQPPNP